MSFAILGLAAAQRSVSLEQMLFDRFGVEATPLSSLIFSFLVAAIPITTFVLLLAMISIWAERKVAGHMQARVGPNRVGPFGLLQSLADGIKLLFKEDLVPGEGDKLLFRIAPYLAFAPVFAAFAAMPFGPEFTFEPRLNSGLFLVLAMLSLEVMGVILAGWASNNKWSVYGAMREACQMVSYEIPLGISLIIGVMIVGSLNFVTMSTAQGGGLHTWLIFRNPFIFLSFFVYFIASLASNKRAPFDLPESESELVAGFHTEYSGMRWAFFFFAEYAAMFIVGGIQTALFLGGWNDPFGLIGYWHERLTADPNSVPLGPLFLLNLIACGIFIAKASTIIFIQMWIRWTLPRPRIDQVLYACVKVLLPLACVLLLGGALWELFVPVRGGIPWRDFNPYSWADWVAGGSGVGTIVMLLLMLTGLALAGGVVAWVGYAIVTGRDIKKRLTEPDLIPERGEEPVTA